MIGNKIAYVIQVNPVYIEEIDGRETAQIVSGQQYSLMLDNTGVVHICRYNSYCRPGLGNEVDVLTRPFLECPEVMTMGLHIADNQEMYWMAGTWNNNGNGSLGKSCSTFRIMRIINCKVAFESCPLVGKDDIVMSLTWGQNTADSELDPEEPKSATKPTRRVPLFRVSIVE
ncbi:hypothetical protein H0H81_002752 [Sphagnurus paluster]|uniref:Uncharacterized protein n=1 Tax=Sphagnurus paluster TaxID=117069 RepID=A0A9P7GNC4_9AGAR|nr:hypothetical protein H0H81_002752 [Sphagnurus paluster]